MFSQCACDAFHPLQSVGMFQFTLIIHLDSEVVERHETWTTGTDSLHGIIADRNRTTTYIKWYIIRVVIHGQLCFHFHFTAGDISVELGVIESLLSLDHRVCWLFLLAGLCSSSRPSYPLLLVFCGFDPADFPICSLRQLHGASGVQIIDSSSLHNVRTPAGSTASPI